MKILELNNQAKVETKTNVLTNDEKIQKLCFPTQKVKAKELMPDFDFLPENEFAIIGNINGNKTVLNNCSSRYTIVNNSEFIPELYDIIGEKFGKENITFNARNFRNANFEFDFVIESNDFYIGGNPQDKLNFKISGSNSYNGKANYNFKFGNQVYRQVCSNGLFAWDLEELFSVSGKHTEKIRRNLVLFSNELEQALNNNIFQKIAASFEPMLQKEIGNWRDTTEMIMNTAGISTQKTNLNEVFETVQKESDQYYGGTVNAWLLYNALNENLYTKNDKTGVAAIEKKDKKVYELVNTI